MLELGSMFFYHHKSMQHHFYVMLLFSFPVLLFFYGIDSLNNKLSPNNGNSDSLSCITFSIFAAMRSVLLSKLKILLGSS